MISITKRGQVYIDDTIICNRPGIVPESVYEYEVVIGVNPSITNPYTVSYATEGTLISFFSVERKHLDKSMLDKAWFLDFHKAYFLCTLSRLDGHLSHWTDMRKFGDILLSKFTESQFQNLGNYAWTFVLSEKERVPTLKLMYMWDALEQRYICPTEFRWSVPKFCEPCNFIKTHHGESKQLTETQLTYPLFGDDIYLKTNYPILICIYCDDVIYPIRVLTKIDKIVTKMRNRSTNKFEALMLARYKMEDTIDLEHRYFTKDELDDFEKRLDEGFNRFKNKIYEKDVLRNWTRFPDKIYNTIRLGDILDKSVSCTEKQHEAVEAIKKCTKGWKKKALFEFYKVYVE